MSETRFERFLILVMIVMWIGTLGLLLRCKFLEADRDYWRTKCEYLEQR